MAILGAAYGLHSAVYVYTNPNGNDLDPQTFDALRYSLTTLRGMKKGDVVRKLRLALLLNGVDISSKPGGLTTSEALAAGLIQSVRLSTGEGMDLRLRRRDLRRWWRRTRSPARVFGAGR